MSSKPTFTTTNELYKLFQQSTGISTDSRTTDKGNLFVALKGEQFDGNQYAIVALQKGAIAAIVSNSTLAEQYDNCYYVSDTTHALGELAHMHRVALATPVILITGTNGKTTTKELVATVLATKYNVHYTHGNLNNHIGLPLTLLQLKPQHEVAIIEAGASHEGEIEYLANIAAPNYGIITNIGKAHLEGFGSFEGVVRTKTELYRYLQLHQGKVFINSCDTLLMEQARTLTKITYGTQNSDVAKGETIHLGDGIQMCFNLTIGGVTHPIKTQLVGNYNLPNALAAAAVGTHFGLSINDIAQALAQYSPGNHRSQLINSSPKGNMLIADVYNANPTSLTTALNNFFSLNTPMPRYVILGDMLELGNAANTEHDAILRLLWGYANEQHIPFCAYLVGGQFASLASSFDATNFRFFHSVDSLKQYLLSTPITNSFALLKASHGMHFENLLALL